MQKIDLNTFYARKVFDLLEKLVRTGLQLDVPKILVPPKILVTQIMLNNMRGMDYV